MPPATPPTRRVRFLKNVDSKKKPRKKGHEYELPTTQARACVEELKLAVYADAPPPESPEAPETTDAPQNVETPEAAEVLDTPEADDFDDETPDAFSA